MEKEPPLKLLGKEGADLDYWSYVGFIAENPMLVQVMCSECYSKSITIRSILDGKTLCSNNITVTMKAIKTTEGMFYLGGCPDCGTIYWGKGNS